MTAGEQLRHWRVHRAGLTQDQMADALACGRTVYANWERDNTTPNARFWLLLADLFEVDCREIAELYYQLWIREGNEANEGSNKRAAG